LSGLPAPDPRPADPAPLGGLAEAVRHGGDVGVLLSQIDWAASPLGPMSTWSAALRSAVTLTLSSQAQICMFWGPDLLAIYNDSYAPTIGVKHPAALGRPAAETWAELWDDLGPLLHGVLRDGRSFSARDRPFQIDRHGFLEQVFFDVSYDPIRGDTGEVEGVICIVSETTKRVLGERRLRLVRDLADRLADEPADGVGAAACDVLESPDVPCCAVLLADDGQLEVLCSSGMRPRDEIEARVRGVLDPGDQPEIDLALLAHGVPEAARPKALVVPLRAGTRTVGAIVAATDRRLPLDDELRAFLGSAAEVVARVVVDHRTRRLERRRAERLRGLTAQLQRAFLPDRLPQLEGLAVAARYLPGSAEVEVGGDWYDALEVAPGRLAVVLGDAVGRGVEAAVVMAQLRTSMRAFLLEGRSAGQALDRLDALTGPVPDAIGSTVLCAVLDVGSGLLHHASAGHLPALVLGADGAPRWLTEGRSPPLGASLGGRATEGLAQLGSGETLVTFTDGLVERRGRSLDEGLAEVARIAAGAAGDPHAIVEQVLGELLADAPPDDTAILAVTRP
jgi:serine phosphatase RsbU (regulator of sigma subunit)